MFKGRSLFRASKERRKEGRQERKKGGRGKGKKEGRKAPKTALDFSSFPWL